MANPIQLPQGNTPWHGPRPWKVALVIVVLGGLTVAMLYYGKDLVGNIVGLFLDLKPSATKTAGGGAMENTTYIKESSNGVVPGAPIDPKVAKREDALLKALEDSKAANERLMKRLEALEDGRKQKEVTPTKAEKPPTLKRAPGIRISHEPEATNRLMQQYVLAAGATKIPCQIETAMNSAVGTSHFTAKVTRPVMDTRTMRHELISQNDTILGKDDGANLVFGNEKLPTFSLTLARHHDPVNPIDLGSSPVTDQVGENGLASEVNHHWWRNIGAAFIVGALNAGRQVITQEIASEAGTVIVAPNQYMTQKLNRAIDTRPTIKVYAGDLCNVLLLQNLTLSEVL